jgi:tight adherence protein B
VSAVLAASGSDWMLYVGAAALFCAIFVAIVAVTLPGVRRRRLAKELAAGTETPSGRSQLSTIGAKAAEYAERGLARHDRDGAIAKALERAGIDVRPAEYLVMVLFSALGAAIVGLLISGLLASLLAAGITVGVFAAVVSLKTSKRCKAFDEQLPDALSLIAGALRAGHSLPQAIDALAQEAESPTAEEFRRALFETQLGHTLPSALRAMAERVRSEDFTWVVQAIEIQGDVGGDLAAVLDNVTSTIRDRTRVRRQIDTLTAEGRLSAIILLALPVLMFLFMVVVNPSYLSELTASLAGIILLITGGTLMVVGAFWLRRITRLAF